MQKLKGSGSTFSTSGKRWMPFRHNPKAAARAAKLHRMIRGGKIAPATKAEMRELADRMSRQGRAIDENSFLSIGR